MKLSRKLSEQLFEITEALQVEQWLRAADKEIGGLRWTALGGRMNNVHSVEVASDSASGIVERTINAFDARLDLEALLRGETAPTPHKAAQQWYGVPKSGIADMSTADRQKLADSIRVVNCESGDQERPTIVTQDKGTGQHPDDFPSTLLSLGESNKKSKTHQIGLYNAGGSSTYAFCKYTIIVSRRAPALLDGRSDEIGVAIVRYNPLDPNKYKSGTYEYCVDAKGGIVRIDLSNGELPDLEYGAYIKHIEYELAAYSRSAHEPKKSLHHLLHAALPNPPLPFWIEETRVDRFPALKGKKKERRVVSGLVARLKNKGVADYSDEREIKLGTDVGSVTLRYFVLNDDQEPDAFVRPSQGLSFVLNGQRHGTQDRYWVKRNTGYNHISDRLIILVECDNLTNDAKRKVFTSTRESSKTGSLPDLIRDRILQELRDDDELVALDEEARQRSLAQATKTASEKVKKQLRDKIAAFIKGAGNGKIGGGTGDGKIGVGKGPGQKTRTKKPPKPPKPRNVDDSAMLEVPDTLTIVKDPIEITPGKTAAVRVYLNAKNDFLPTYSKNLSVVVGKSLQDKIKLTSTGRLLGGHSRITVAAEVDAPIGTSETITVILAIPELSVALMAQATIEVVEPETEEDSRSGGADVDVDIRWIGRDKWMDQTPVWDEVTVGVCHIYRRDLKDPKAITRVDWLLNEAFKPYESVIETKKLGEAALKRFQEGYQVPVSWALFNQQLAEAQIGNGEEENRGTLPADYLKAERARVAQAVLIAMEPEVSTVALEGAA